ncbi:MAG: sulfurtransferase [Planctomycetes bacterium]|nr:sulfurtransferase [Planctomycetota bacterium]
MDKHHAPGFLRVVDAAKAQISESTVEALRARQVAGTPPRVLDVREESEFARDRIVGAEHLGKGILERDVEARVPDLATELVLYCGGGFRSALAAESLQRMGYTRVSSLAGGIRAWREAGYPLEA